MILRRVNYFGNKFRGLFHHQRRYNHEGDGKTTVSFLTREAEGRLMITAYNKVGFRLSSGLFVVGPVIVFPKTLLSWNVANDEDISEDSLTLFYNMEPKVDLVVVGMSDTENCFGDRSFYMDKFNLLRKSKLNFELLPTEKAIATYNFLCAENRFVAAALIPPKKVIYSDYDTNAHNFEKSMIGEDDYFFGDGKTKADVAEEKKNEEIGQVLKTDGKETTMVDELRKAIKNDDKKK